MASPIHRSTLREAPSIPAGGNMVGAMLPLDYVGGTESSFVRSNLEEEHDDRAEEKRLKKTVGSREERRQQMLEWLLNKYS